MGEVFLAEDDRLGRPVALKTVAPLASSPTACERLLREARAAARLNHPNIAAIYDVLEVGGVAHVVMEFVDGEPLSVRLRRGPLPVDETIAIGIQLCEALAEAHAHGIVHRDLKPSNVQLARSGRVKVLDFGLAKSAGEVADPDDSTAEKLALTAPGHVVGTPAYMAPEQLRKGVADARTDIYSLGALLFELLTGRRPFQGHDFIALSLAILSDRTPVASELNPEVPDALAGVVARAMARDPGQRYGSARDLQADLERLRRGSGHGATAAPAPPTWRVPLSGRRRVLLTGVAALVAVGAAGLALRPRLHRSAVGGPRPIVAVLPFENATGDAANDALAAIAADSLSGNLAVVSGLTVIPRREVAASTAGEPPARVARAVGATSLVRGALRGPPARLAVDLVGADGAVAWSSEVPVSANDLLSVERPLTSVAETIAERLGLLVSAADRDRMGKRPSTDPGAYAAFAQGRALLDRPDVKGNVARAVDLLGQAVAGDPHFALAHAARGEAFWARYQETREAEWTHRATEAVLEALRLDPDRPQVRMALAEIYSGTGRADAAAEELRKVLQREPGNHFCRGLLAQTLADSGRAEEAEREFRQAIGDAPGYWRNHARLGYLLFRQGRHKEAVDALTAATRLQPDNAWGFQMLGAANHALGDRERAKAAYVQANRVKPEALAWSGLGTVAYEEGRFEDAVTAYREALALRPKSAGTHRNLGDAYARLGRRDEARAEYAEAVSLVQAALAVNANDAAALAMLGVYEAKLGRGSDALRHAAAAVALQPRDPDVVYRKAVVHALAGQAGEALATLELAFALGQSRSVAAADDDLAPLRTAPRWRSLLFPSVDPATRR